MIRNRRRLPAPWETRALHCMLLVQVVVLYAPLAAASPEAVEHHGSAMAPPLLPRSHGTATAPAQRIGGIRGHAKESRDRGTSRAQSVPRWLNLGEPAMLCSLAQLSGPHDRERCASTRQTGQFCSASQSGSQGTWMKVFLTWMQCPGKSQLRLTRGVDEPCAAPPSNARGISPA